MSNRFSYVKYDETAMAEQNKLREVFEELEKFVDQLTHTRPRSLAYTALEEAYMWVGKAIRDDQIARTGVVDEQPERNNE